MGFLTPEEVRNEALKVRKAHFRTGVSTYAWLKGLVESLGGRIEFVEHGENTDRIEVNNGEIKKISLPTNVSEVRNNFTIAHELGHFFLHYKFDNSPAVFERKGSDQKEWQANWFAAELLMPKSDFEKASKALRHNPSLLARKFGVSTAAVKVRLMALNI